MFSGGVNDDRFIECSNLQQEELGLLLFNSTNVAGTAVTNIHSEAVCEDFSTRNVPEISTTSGSSRGIWVARGRSSPGVACYGRFRAPIRVGLNVGVFYPQGFQRLLIVYRINVSQHQVSQTGQRAFLYVQESEMWPQFCR